MSITFCSSSRPGGQLRTVRRRAILGTQAIGKKMQILMETNLCEELTDMLSQFCHCRTTEVGQSVTIEFSSQSVHFGYPPHLISYTSMNKDVYLRPPLTVSESDFMTAADCFSFSNPNSLLRIMHPCSATRRDRRVKEAPDHSDQSA